MESTTEDWLSQRIGKFTASNVHKLLVGGKRPMTEEELFEAKKNKILRKTADTTFGEGAYTYIKEVLHEALTGEMKPTPTTYAMQWGLDWEETAIQEFEKILGKKVTHFGVKNPEFFHFNEMSGGSPDGEVEEDDAVVEVKCPGPVFLDYLLISKRASFSSNEYEGSVNDWLKDYAFDYYCQTQFNMLILKRSKAYFVVFDPRIKTEHLKIAVLEIQPDKEIQELIVDRIDKAKQILIDKLDILGF